MTAEMVVATGVPITYVHVRDPARGRYREAEVLTGAVRTTAPFAIGIDPGQI